MNEGVLMFYNLHGLALVVPESMNKSVLECSHNSLVKMILKVRAKIIGIWLYAICVNVRVHIYEY